MRSTLALLLGLLLAACQAGASTPAPGSSAIASREPASDAPPTTAQTAPPATLVPGPTGRLAFQRNDPSNGGVFTINVDGTDEHAVRKGSYGTPKWSPDGTWLAMYAEKQSSVVPALVRPDGSDYVELPLPMGLSCGQAAWAPDGLRLALECWNESDQTKTGIWLIGSADGSDPVQLTHGHGLPGSFSPDGRTLVFGQDAADGSVQPMLIGIDGSNERTLVPSGIGPMPGFMPDGASVYVVIDGVIQVLDLSGRPLRSISAPEPKIYEAVLSPDGRWFALGYDPHNTAAPGLYRLSVDGTRFSIVINSNVADSEEVHPDWMP